jgi:predicted transposase YdaD
MHVVATLEVRVSHDQLFKDVLRAFFPQFLQIFFPDIAASIDLDGVSFRESEIFTDVPEGERRTADMVAEVHSQGSEALVLLHTEFQGRRRPNLGYRLWEYNVGLRLRDRLPVISITLLLSGGTPGITLEIYEETLFGQSYPLLAYWQIGLRDLNAADYSGAAQDLAIALAALMKPGPEGRAGLKLTLLRRLQASTLDEARLFLLVNMVETYLRLETAEIAEFRAQMQREGAMDTELAEMTWADELMERGRAQGMQQGMERGMEQGKREAIVRLLRVRFHTVPVDLPGRLANLDAARLDVVLDKAEYLSSLEEFLAAL